MEMTRRQALLTGALGAFGIMNLGLDEAASAQPIKNSESETPISSRKGRRSGKVTLVQINDSHAYLDLHLEWFAAAHMPAYRLAGGYARIATLLRKIREETKGRTLFFDNGDTFHGTYPVVQSKGECLVPIFNELDPVAMTVHWDFAYGPKQLENLAANLRYPILAGNIYTPDGRKFFEAVQIREIDGLRIGIIGIASNIIDKTMPPHFSEGLRFTDGWKELPGLIQQLHTKDVDLVVVLSHLGFPQDMQLLSEVPGVDVLLSGHTHHRLFAPVNRTNGCNCRTSANRGARRNQG